MLSGSLGRESSGVNLEGKYGVGAPKSVRCGPQPRSGNPTATALVPNRNSFAVSLDQSVTWRGGTCYMGNSQSSTYHRPDRHTSELASHTDKTTLQTGEDTPASPCGVDTTRGAPVTGYKPSHDWRKARRQGLLPTVGGILGSHWRAIARLKLYSPQTERCCPATVCHSHWVHGD